MKKSFKVMLAAAMLFSATLSANAQFSKKEDNRTPDRFHMGMRGGVTANSISLSEGSVDGLVFVYGGFNMDFQIAPIPIFLETGLYYMNKGWKNEYYGYKSEKADDHFINMPILASYHINVAPNLFIQPFFGGVGGYLTETDAFDAAIRVGCGMNFGRLYVNLGYDIGVVSHDIYYSYSKYSTKTDYTNNTFFATIGFNWAGSR